MISDTEKTLAHNYITNKLKKRKSKKHKSDGDLHAIKCLKIVLQLLSRE